MALLQAFALGLIALILTPGWLFYFDVTPKLAVLLAAAAVLVLFVQRRRVHWLLAAYALSILLSSAFSTHPALSWFGSGWRRYGAVAQLAVLIFATAVSALPDRRIVLRGITLATAIAALYGIAQFAGFDPILPASAYHIGEGIWTIVRPPSTFGYVSYFATWLVMASFLAASYARQEENATWRRAAYAISALSAIAMLLTGTRAAILALAAGALVFRVPRRVLAIAAATALALAALYISPAGRLLRSRTRWFAEDPWGGARLTLWRDSLAMGLQRPLLGHGPEVFIPDFPRYESESLARAYPDFVHESPHNLFLDALISQGLPGLLLLAALLIQGLRTRDPAIAAALTAGIVSQQFTVFTIPTALLTFVTLALASPAPKPAPTPRPQLLLIPVTLALLYCALRFTAADAWLARAQTHLAHSDPRQADADFAEYTAWRFPGASADLWYSRALLDLAARAPGPAVRIQSLARSRSAALQATSSAEDPFHAWYQAAQLAASANDIDGAERALRAAIAARPRWFKPHWTLARLLYLRNRRAEADAEAAIALRLDAGKHEEVSRTLAEAAQH